MPAIKPVDAVRKPEEMKPADLEGLEGKWLDVPRLQQKSTEVRSSFWCGRASAAMVYNYYCKEQKKTDQYIGHDDGDVGPGANGGKFNLRFLGGSNKGKLAGVDDTGAVNPDQIFKLAGWKTDSGELGENPNPDQVEKVFARHIELLKKNNPIVQYTLLSQDRGHIVVINGYKKDSDRGELWLRIVDPDYPQEDLLGTGNFLVITRPEKPDKEFSEYWLKASRLLADHPKKQGKKLFQHADAEHGHFLYAAPDTAVKDDSELIHKVQKGLGETAKPSPAGAQQGQAATPAGPEPACPPITGIPRLPFAINGATLVTGEAITSLYHQTERGQGGFFPLGDSGLFHSGAHVTPAAGSEIMAMADGEMVAARIGGGPGEHPWGDTGFVILRHKVKGDKLVYCMYLHLKREVLHPDQTDCGWLSRLLIDAIQDKEKKKPKWRVMEAQPTWKDADKGKFSPTNADTTAKLDPGVYEEEDEIVQESKRYVKVKGKWIRAVGPDGSGPKVKELSPWADFDLDAACKKDPHVKDLRDGKVAVFDDLKSDDGKGHKVVVEAGETVGKSGSYLGSQSMHWSVFTKDAVFPSGSLGDAEFTADQAPNVADLDLSSKEHGTKEHATALVEAVDPKKQVIGKKEMEWIVEPGELRHFYRTPTQCWRARYQAVKGLADFKLDLDKLTKQDRYKSHTDKEKGDFVKNGKAFLFWDDLSKAENFPTDGKGIFVHPVTALRMMAKVRVEQDHDDPPPEAGVNAADRLHPAEDVVLVVRDAKGALAAVDVTVKADGKEIFKGKTDSQGEIVVKLEDCVGKDIEVSVDANTVGEKGMLVQVANETASASTLTPGDAPGNQKFNSEEVVPNPRMGLQMKVKKGAMVKQFGTWDADKLETSAPGALLEPEASITVERIVYRSDDGKKECVSIFVANKEVFVWTIENGEEKIALNLPAEQAQKKDPNVIGSWSARIAHLKDHPILAGRVQNIDEGTELEVHWLAIMSIGAPEHDHEVGVGKCKVAAGGFAIAFDPHLLTSDNNLLNQPRPVSAKLKAKDKEISLRDQAITVYGDAKFPDPKPAPEQPGPKGPGAKAKEIVGWLEIDRHGDIDRPNGWGGKEHERFASRKMTQLTGAITHRLVMDGADDIWVAPCRPSQHLAVGDQATMPVADATAAHTKAIKTAYPDAPDWLIIGDPAASAKADNGIQTGICAKDCQTSVNAQGRKSGCTEAIRTQNLKSCINGADKMCQTAVQLGKVVTVKKDGCPGLPASCGAAQHDKSKCYVAGVVKGDGAEERERWHVRLPLRTSGAGYPYIRDTGKNMRVLLINPASGAAVVCSQEARGPQDDKCDGNIAVAEAAVEKDEFKDKDTFIQASYEAFWKLGLSRAGGGEAVVLLAFCDVNTPLGPVPDDVPLKLKKTISFEELMGDSPPVVPGEPGTKVKSGNILVAGRHFADWFNTDFWPLHKGRHPTLVYGKDGMHPIEFPGPIQKANFQKIFDHCEPLYAKEISVGEFVAIICIMLNEVGGQLKAIGELNGPKYMFEAGPRKQSYNGILGNKKAGDQLLAMGAITEDQKDAWNKHDGAVWPDGADDILDKVKECDFYKFRGHGLNQLTGRGNYDAHMNKFLKQYCGKGMDDMTGAEMEDAIQNKPEVYLSSFKSFFMKQGMKKAMEETNDGEFWKVGKINSGGDQYADLFEWRCKTLLEAMTQATYEFR